LSGRRGGGGGGGQDADEKEEDEMLGVVGSFAKKTRDEGPQCGEVEIDIFNCLGFKWLFLSHMVTSQEPFGMCIIAHVASRKQ
jgi:hypothetical protein